MKCCSLDDFIEGNKYEVRVSPFSEPVKFKEIDYFVPPGLLFDLLALKGRGYQLEVSSVREDTDISQSENVGFGFIVDREGNKTGYHLISYGGQNPDGTGNYHGFYIDNDQREAESSEERMKKSKKGTELLAGLPRSRMPA